MTQELKIRKPFNGEYRISFKFGENPGWYVKRFGYPHNGVDYATPVGVVIRASDKGGMGTWITEVELRNE